MLSKVELAKIRQARAVKTVRYNTGKEIQIDARMQTLLGVLRTIKGLRTTGSCGGHKIRRGEFAQCSQPEGHWFVSFRAARADLDRLQTFAATAGIRFDKGPYHTLPLCGVCVSETEKTWYGFWGSNDPRRVAAQLQRYLML